MTASAFEAVVIAVPSDPKAKYTVLDVKRLDSNLVVVTSRRDGPSGTSFARREVDCGSNAYRYTGDADTLDELDSQNLDSEMGPLEDGSISDVISRFACGEV